LNCSFELHGCTKQYQNSWIYSIRSQDNYLEESLNVKCTKKKDHSGNDLIMPHKWKEIVLNNLRATNLVPPGNDQQCGWEERTDCACWDEALRKQLGMLKRKLLGSSQERDDASQFLSSDIS
jgi:hypothetical protein